MSATTKVTAAENKLIEDILELVHSRSNILLSSHVGPDGDSLGSQIAFYHYLKSIGKNVWIYNQGHIPHYFHGFKDLDLIVVEPEKWDVPPEGFDLVIIFECTSLDRIGDVSNLVKDNVDIVNIDHHPENDEYGKINYLDASASSAGEMVYRILKKSGYKIDPDTATYIYIAILTDTGRFHFTSTSPECLHAAADLVASGVNVKELTDQIYYNFTEDQLRFTAEIVSRMETHLDGRVCFLTLREAELKERGLKYGDMEGLVEWTMRVRKVQVGALFKDTKPNFSKISLRSQGNIDVCKLAHRFNGGGHSNAAGCHIEADLETAKKILLEALEEILPDDE
ncbi:MAG: bifunctional oligoribonuclease/PAP phosphatase NrnA [candidate division Zixibacteria bacterium]|nr:bifunctional oligoribonuclease/PAP phosphatase NrnA [candidate division Zixibacteria bacterium]NIR63735.1 bifunctional oligoribonuclease/PAP phosphatase NrnA [candidate division Zixibacteria bacterium]NIS14692.1 bifunctional oligoribonuclease/PAP phosphatase NrnA [candidate division Zixibacteria bacterium]NIS45691.1 bifunctional oligoribonuclease/PAP phosphatase NrnA [candidate division Zixibacteria bacterium]NIT51220.1 bifunctional oligoribonuclease/PAP phosphatase NrnA [candidate division 